MKKQATSWLRIISGMAVLIVFLATIGAGAIETRVRVAHVEASVARVEKDTAEALRDIRTRLDRIEQALHKIHVELAQLCQRVEDHMVRDY